MLTAATINGVNLEALAQTIHAIRKEPGLAAFRFRATNQWLDCGHNRTTVAGLQGTNQEMGADRAFTLDADEPPVLLGEDQGANQVEFVLHALAACLTTSLVYHAAARGLHIDSLESRLEDDLDLRGFLGIDPEVRKGYQAIRVTFTIASDAPVETLRELAQFSPVYDMVSRAVPVTTRFEKRQRGSGCPASTRRPAA